jgi:carbon monoxide dehydrogenase subunit G
MITDQFDNSFTVPLLPEQAWRILTDVRRIASCVPGVQLNEAENDGTYLGRFSVHLAGMPLSFACMVKFAELDRAELRARLQAHGQSDSGKGRVDADIYFRLMPAVGGSMVGVHTDLVLSGTAAMYGGSVRLLQGTAAQIMAQFSSNLAGHLAAEAAQVA